MRENLMSGSMWQGMEIRQGDGTEALSQETESNGSATPKLWRHPLTLPACPASPDGLSQGYFRGMQSRQAGPDQQFRKWRLSVSLVLDCVISGLKMQR